MNVLEIVSLVLNLVFGTGFIVTLVTLKSARSEADAKAKLAVSEYKTNEIQNVESAIKIWREMAEQMSDKYDEVIHELDKLRKEVNRLNRINTRIMKLLDKITPDNMEIIVEQIKEEIKNESKDELHISHNN
ncbi:MAG: hypothetical protein AB7E34_10590 [Acidaminococcaceae bacterium]|jgi:lipopolysaccharide biosynthesis regulator YciM